MRAAVEEHALAALRSLEHRRRILGQIGLNDERRKRLGVGATRSDPSSSAR
jgi:hypothetical protein